jgi:hypothetical protein
LEKIKKRLIEYLAVVRLNQINAAQDEAQEALAKATAAADSANPNPSGVPSSPEHTVDASNSKVSKSKRVKGPILLCVLSIATVQFARIHSRNGQICRTAWYG